MKKLNDQELLQFTVLNFVVNCLLFFFGLFVGQSAMCFVLDVTMTKQLSHFSLMGIFMAMGALASYQAREYTMKKLQSLVQDMR